MEALAFLLMAVSAFLLTRPPETPAPPPAPVVAAPEAQPSAAPPPDRVILLAGADGKVGAVEVRSLAQPDRPLLLSVAGAAARIDTGGAVVAAAPDTTDPRQRYASTLAAIPKAPMSFTIQFETGSATQFAQGSRQELDQLRRALADYPAPEITVIGHTDRVGSVSFNDALSLRRAHTIRQYLEDLGIRALRMDVAGRGEREPLVPTADEVAEPRNRRVEINLR